MCFVLSGGCLEFYSRVLFLLGLGLCGDGWV